MKWNKPIALMAIISNILPSVASFFFVISIPVALLGGIYLIIKPKDNFIYYLGLGILIIGIIIGGLISISCIKEMNQ